MKLKIEVVLIFVSIFWISTVWANESLKNLLENCENDGSLKSIGFAEIEEQKRKTKNSSKYKIVSEYKNNTFSKQGKEYGEIWFYSYIQKDEYGKRPDFIWHIIAIPSEIQRKYSIRGYANKKTIRHSTKQKLINKAEKKYLKANKTIKEINNIPFYVNNKISDIDNRRSVNDIWEKLITCTYMQPIYDEIDKINEHNNVYYDFTIYLYPIDSEADYINLEKGYLVPSSKKVKECGTVYGFVLNKERDCIGYQTLNIVK